MEGPSKATHYKGMAHCKEGAKRGKLSIIPFSIQKYFTRFSCIISLPLLSKITGKMAKRNYFLHLPEFIKRSFHVASFDSLFSSDWH